jgi:hypothetical protein
MDMVQMQLASLALRTRERVGELPETTLHVILHQADRGLIGLNYNRSGGNRRGTFLVDFDKSLK